MPIEIRELIIRTEITTMGGQSIQGNLNKTLNKLKKQVLEECKRTIAVAVKRDKTRR